MRWNLLDTGTRWDQGDDQGRSSLKHGEPTRVCVFKMSQAVDPSEEMNFFVCFQRNDCASHPCEGALADRKFREDEIKAPNLHVGGAETEKSLLLEQG